MFRNIAAISFICLSAGSLTAETALDQNTIENTQIKKVLTALLRERASFGPGPVPLSARENTAMNRIALEQYLARRDSWGTAPASAAARANAQALAAYLAQRKSWGSAPDAITAENQRALAAYLALRDSWGSAPASVAARANAQALAAYLARREGWGAGPAPHHRSALAAYLARRDSWGSAPTRPAANPHGGALAAYLARRDSWGAGSIAVASNRNAKALTAYLARRDSWGAGPAKKPNAIASALDSLLRVRASWGSRPAITSAEANRQPGLTLAAYLERRARWNEAGATRVAAFTMTRPAQEAPMNCAATLHQLTSSGAFTFAFDSTRLTDESGGRLEQVAVAGRDCTGFRIRIKGHTDSTGDAAMNQALSEKRASAVADYLQAAGIDAAAIEAIGFGESQPLVPNTTRANRAQNRRIELTVLKN